MNHQNIPAGTRAQVLRAVIAERHPKIALGAIAARFAIPYQDLRIIIEQAGYPDSARMRTAAADLELEDARQTDPDDEHVGSTQAAPANDEGRLTTVRVTDLHVDPDNPRDLPKPSDPDIEELADSMLEAGLLQPTVSRRGDDGSLYVVAGHRRLVAARRLKWSTVSTIIRGPMPSDQVLAAMLIENGQRKDLDPIEEARGLRRLKATADLSDAQLARKIGRTQVHVSGRLALLSLSAEDQAAIRAGDMTLTEGAHKGRLNSGKLRPTGIDRNWHLGPAHPLADRVKARCQRLRHLKGRKVGGMGCGDCWETVIRADERDHLHEVNAKLGECVTCGQPVETTAPDNAEAVPA